MSESVRRTNKIGNLQSGDSFCGADVRIESCPCGYILFEKWRTQQATLNTSRDVVAMHPHNTAGYAEIEKVESENANPGQEALGARKSRRMRALRALPQTRCGLWPKIARGNTAFAVKSLTEIRGNQICIGPGCIHIWGGSWWIGIIRS